MNRMLILVALIFYSFFISQTAFDIGGTTYFTLIDDAMISMTYGRNLSEGNGLTWGGERIAGFTNPGWTLLMSAVHLLPIGESKISLVMMMLSALMLTGCAAVSSLITKQITENRAAPIIAAIATAFFYPLVYWSLRGMEVAAITLLIEVAVLLSLRGSNSLLIGLACFAAVFLRQDAILQVGLIYCYLLTTGIKRLAIASIPLVIGMGALITAQLLYYGSIYPNTYYLKVAGVDAYERLAVGIQTFWVYAAQDIVVPLILSTIAFRLIRRPVFALLFCLFAVQVCYSLYVGGDYAEPLHVMQVGGANRFIAQGVPFLIVLAALSTGKAIERLPQPASILCGLLLLLAISGNEWSRWSTTGTPLLRADIKRTETACTIRRTTAPDAVIAAHAVGQTAYYSRRRVIDLLGKNDAVIASGKPSGPFRPGHNKWNYSYSIGQLHPDLIVDRWGDSVEYLAGRSDYQRINGGMYERLKE